VQLLARTARGASLTEAGATFRDYAARICAEINIARETILRAGKLRRRLRIAAPLPFRPTHLVQVFADLARRHPFHTCTPAAAIGTSVSWQRDMTVPTGSATSTFPI
jgi:DNA-binding transcriptional LysR family regulator